MARKRGWVSWGGWAAGGGFYSLLGLFGLGMSPGNVSHRSKHA